MMSTPLEVTTRGVDSSGRTVRATRQAFQHFDRVNAKVDNLLVIVQGAFVSGTLASAGTHDRAGCLDIRTWNLTLLQRYTALHTARELMAAAWYRHAGQGFDPHIHWVLIGDAPMASLATSQIDMYRKGYNGLGWYAYPDDFAYRPNPIVNYKYLEEDMKADERRELFRIGKQLDRFAEGERERDKTEREKFRSLVTLLGSHADQLTVAINMAKDDATKNQLRKMQEKILLQLKGDPDIKEEDNPSDEGLAERNMG
jgi:hypothetical protein